MPGTETLNEYMADTWIPTHWSVLGEKTRRGYKSLYAVYLEPTFGPLPLRELSPELIGRWQADHLKGGAGRRLHRRRSRCSETFCNAPPRAAGSRPPGTACTQGQGPKVTRDHAIGAERC